jgi:hypothetical protein
LAASSDGSCADPYAPPTDPNRRIPEWRWAIDPKTGTIYECRNGVLVLIKSGSGGAMRQLKSTSPGLCIGVAGSSAALDAQVVQGSCVPGDPSQSWAQISDLTSGSYGALVNWNSGLCIDVDASTTLLFQDYCDSSYLGEFWVKNPSGSTWIFQNYTVSQQVLTVPGCYNIGGLQLAVYPNLNLSCQNWAILAEP